MTPHSEKAKALTPHFWHFSFRISVHFAFRTIKKRPCALKFRILSAVRQTLMWVLYFFVPSNKTNMKTKILIAVLSLLSFTAFAQTDFNVRKKHFNLDKNSLAIQGYDPISYFEGKPQKGLAQFLVFYKGVQYYFVSAAHKEQFLKTPDKYEPAYGGWCSYAMGEYGEKVEIDPTSYKIVNGKLNLLYYSFINKTLNKWNQNETVLKSKADVNWKTIINK